MLVPPFSIAGYRSFGPTVQRFQNFSKLNLFIGPNNCGKSNVLKFIHEVFPKFASRDEVALGPLDKHFPRYGEFLCGLRVSLQLNQEQSSYADFNAFVLPLFGEGRQGAAGYALKLFQRKASLDGMDDVWFEFKQDKSLAAREGWQTAFDVLNDREASNLWNALTSHTGGGRNEHWIPESLRRLTPQFPTFKAQLIPAIRRVGIKGSVSEDFSGDGLIERLARLQNPDVHRQVDRRKFQQINRFLKTVTDNDSATIEIPHERDTIIVHIDGRALPLDSLGTGIQEVIILAAASTILENTVVCMEEPELHLNPILQKKLVRYLVTDTSNQYFITTHSAALMDTPDAEVYHLQLMDGQSMVERVTSDKGRSAVCEDLGYHPSDLLQANCIIWVEGPSDRIYINKWIGHRAPDLVEGVHYSIMFYGGRLAAHLTAQDIDEEVNDFISLRRLNRRALIVIDGDRASAKVELNATKQRLVAEFNNGPGYAWVTDGREIENYIPPEQICEAIRTVLPKCEPTSRLGRYDKVLKLEGKKNKQAPKVEIAKYIAANFEVDESRFNLKGKLDSLVSFIKESNPRGVHVGG